jgi:hypothetical protein
VTLSLLLIPTTELPGWNSRSPWPPAIVTEYPVAGPGSGGEVDVVDEGVVVGVDVVLVVTDGVGGSVVVVVGPPPSGGGVVHTAAIAAATTTPTQRLPPPRGAVAMRLTWADSPTCCPGLLR